MPAAVKKVLFRLAAAALGLAAVLLLLEVVLRFLPVNEGLWTLPVNVENPVLRFQPDRTSTWSRFPDFSMVNEVRTNNWGFLNDSDYLPDDPRELVAVMGDSYVEAAMVPFERTGHGLLARELAARARVYSFASSGSALSQYLAYARFARDNFRPRKMIFLVVGNDFDESLLKYKSTPPFHYFGEDAEGALRLVRLDWAPSPATRLARRSRLAMYLLVNADVLNLPSRLEAALGRIVGGRGERYVGNVQARVDEERLADSKRAVDAFLDFLPGMSGLDPGAVLLAVDGMRPSLYREEDLRQAESSYFGTMRRYLMEAAASRGCRVLDLQPAFTGDFRERGRRFEFERDGHWNEEGHRVFCRAVLDSGFLDEYR